MSRVAEHGTPASTAAPGIDGAVAAFLDVARATDAHAPRAAARAAAYDLIGESTDVRAKGLVVLHDVASAMPFTVLADVITDTWREFDAWHAEWGGADDD